MRNSAPIFTSYYIIHLPLNIIMDESQYAFVTFTKHVMIDVMEKLIVHASGAPCTTEHIFSN